MCGLARSRKLSQNVNWIIWRFHQTFIIVIIETFCTYNFVVAAAVFFFNFSDKMRLCFDALHHTAAKNYNNDGGEGGEQ